MAELIVAPRNAGPPDPARVVPPLPPEIPILPGQARAAKAASRLSGRNLLFGIAAIAALILVLNWYSGYDGKRIEAVVTPAMFAHAQFGTLLPVTLWGGPRVLSIGSSYIQPGMPPTTCVSVYVHDPITGAVNPRENYTYCISGLAYRIPYPMAH